MWGRIAFRVAAIYYLKHKIKKEMIKTLKETGKCELTHIVFFFKKKSGSSYLLLGDPDVDDSRQRHQSSYYKYLYRIIGRYNDNISSQRQYQKGRRNYKEETNGNSKVENTVTQTKQNKKSKHNRVQP